MSVDYIRAERKRPAVKLASLAPVCGSHHSVGAGLRSGISLNSRPIKQTISGLLSPPPTHTHTHHQSHRIPKTRNSVELNPLRSKHKWFGLNATTGPIPQTTFRSDCPDLYQDFMRSFFRPPSSVVTCSVFSLHNPADEQTTDTWTGVSTRSPAPVNCLSSAWSHINPSSFFSSMLYMLLFCSCSQLHSESLVLLSVLEEGSSHVSPSEVPTV